MLTAQTSRIVYRKMVSLLDWGSENEPSLHLVMRLVDLSEDSDGEIGQIW